MANERRKRVLFIDSDGQIDGVLRVRGIKLVGGSTAATLVIRTDSSTGGIIYEERAPANVDTYDVDLDLIFLNGAYFDIGGTGAKAYVYLA